MELYHLVYHLHDLFPRKYPWQRPPPSQIKNLSADFLCHTSFREYDFPDWPGLIRTHKMDHFYFRFFMFQSLTLKHRTQCFMAWESHWRVQRLGEMKNKRITATWEQTAQKLWRPTLLSGERQHWSDFNYNTAQSTPDDLVKMGRPTSGGGKVR